MYADKQELTIALSMEALRRTVMAESAFRTIMDPKLNNSSALSEREISLPDEVIRQAIGLTILRLHRMVKATDLDAEQDVVHLTLDPRRGCFTSELRQVRRIVEDAVVAWVLREWFGFYVPFDSIDALDWL
ncbi:MAG: hypothetical protein NC127_06335 [Muribaculum sp.]|nr:hypothetical protein [Muribaculum sp.]